MHRLNRRSGIDIKYTKIKMSNRRHSFPGARGKASGSESSSGDARAVIRLDAVGYRPLPESLVHLCLKCESDSRRAASSSTRRSDDVSAAAFTRLRKPPSSFDAPQHSGVENTRHRPAAQLKNGGVKRERQVTRDPPVKWFILPIKLS